MKKIILILLTSLLFANSCNTKLFTLNVVDTIKLKDILKELVYECNLNITIKDAKAKEKLEDNLELISLKNVHLTKLLDTLFNNVNLFYTLRNSSLIISYYKTKIFKVDFIPNSMSGTSNVDSTGSSVSNNYSFDFWANLEDNIVRILRNVDSDYKKPIIDKNSGLVTVTGTKEQLNEVEKYINSLNSRLHKEVLIDVKIYSVTLSKTHSTGINWSTFNISLNSAMPVSIKNVVGSNSIFKTSVLNTTALLNFLSQNGNVNSISNPKIVTLNNQKAVIRVGDTIYFKYASGVTNNNGISTTQYTIDSKFVGVLLDITPQISDNGEIILSINPRISSFKDATQLTNPNRDMPPDTQDNTMMSVVKLRNNETLILGGLITDDNTLRVNGVPVLKEIPIIKYLFSSKEKITTKKELVFVITPHIIDLNKKFSVKKYGFGKLPTLEELHVK